MSVDVIYPVTPNGVEHVDFLPESRRRLVIYPVTPNGVEHVHPLNQGHQGRP